MATTRRKKQLEKMAEEAFVISHAERRGEIEAEREAKSELVPIGGQTFSQEYITGVIDEWISRRIIH